MASQSKGLKKSAKKRPAYHRILLKLSGESFQGPHGFGIHGETIYAIAKLGENIAIRRFARFKVGEVPNQQATPAPDQA